LNLELMIPELVLLACAIIVIMLDLFLKRKGWLAVISLAGLAIAAGFTIASWGGNSQALFSNMLVVDKFAVFFKLLFLSISALVILASIDYVNKFAEFQGEYYALLLLSTLGMMLMAGATLVGIGSAVVSEGPAVFSRIQQELAQFMTEHGDLRIEDLRGKALP